MARGADARVDVGAGGICPIGVGTALPQVISAWQALSLSANGDRSARDQAVSSLQAAQTLIVPARWEGAISKLVDAAGDLDSIGSVDVTAYRASVDVMKEVAQWWWAALLPCPATPACR